MTYLNDYNVLSYRTMELYCHIVLKMIIEISE